MQTETDPLLVMKNSLNVERLVSVFPALLESPNSRRVLPSGK